MRRALLPALLAALLASQPVATKADPAVNGDDTDFLFRLGLMEGHLVIGHQLLQANQRALALPHFGHPVRELYDDVAPYVAAKHLQPFDTTLIRLEAAVASSKDNAATEKLYADTIAQLHAARLAVPEQVRQSMPEMIKLCSTTLEAAAGEYGEAVNNGKIDALVEYHDSRGYVAYTAGQVDALARSHLDAPSQDLIARFRTVLAKMQYVVEPLVPGPMPRATVASYRAMAADAAALTKTP